MEIVYGEALADHQRILREAFAEHGGHEIDTQGDSFFVAFGRAKDAVSCAIACQRRLAEHSWPDDTQLRVRMGIHTGEPAMGGQRYVGLGVNRGARIAAAGHGGQVLVSQTTRELLRDDPVPDVSLRDLGEHQLKDMDEPERIYQLVAPGLQDDFPELKTAASTPFEGREGELAEAAAQEMAKRWRRPDAGVLIGATFAAALVGAIFGVLLTQGGGSNANASVSANAVGVIDPDGRQRRRRDSGRRRPGRGRRRRRTRLGHEHRREHGLADRPVDERRRADDRGRRRARRRRRQRRRRLGRQRTRRNVSRIDARRTGSSQTITVGNGPTGVACGRRSHLGDELDRRNGHPDRSGLRPR